MTQTHTPLPWKSVSQPNFDNGLVYTSIQPVNVDKDNMRHLAMMNGEHHICRMSHTAAEWRFSRHRADAAFIVTACNSYYDNQATIASQAAEIARLREENARLWSFAKEFFQDAVSGDDCPGFEIEERGLRHGIFKKVPFDPKMHKDPTGEASEGDWWVVLSERSTGPTEESR